jgi:hypothetical protein
MVRTRLALYYSAHNVIFKASRVTVQRDYTHINLLNLRAAVEKSKDLSDFNGIDPGIHGSTAIGMISCALSGLAQRARNPNPGQIERIVDSFGKTFCQPFGLKTLRMRPRCEPVLTRIELFEKACECSLLVNLGLSHVEGIIGFVRSK